MSQVDEMRGVQLDALSQFIREVRAVSPLTNDEEAVLLARAKAGNVNARDRLVEGYQPFAVGIAKRFQSRCELLDLLDLAQEGTIGLLHALDALPKRATTMPFRVFAFYFIRNAMLQAIYRCERTIRLPLRTLKRLRRLATAQGQILCELGREATVDELVTALHLTQQEVIDLLLLQAERFTSLDAPCTDESELSLADTLPALDATTLQQPSRLHRWLRSVIEGLPERERQVMTLRYGFDGDAAHTTRQVADLLGLSHGLVQDIDRRVRLRIQVAIQDGRSALAWAGRAA